VTNASKRAVSVTYPPAGLADTMTRSIVPVAKVRSAKNAMTSTTIKGAVMSKEQRYRWLIRCKCGKHWTVVVEGRDGPTDKQARCRRCKQVSDNVSMGMRGTGLVRDE